VEAPQKARRDEFVDQYFRGAKPDQVVVIVKARESARIMTAIGDKNTNRWHLQIASRWVVRTRRLPKQQGRRGLSQGERLVAKLSVRRNIELDTGP